MEIIRIIHFYNTCTFFRITDETRVGEEVVVKVENCLTKKCFNHSLSYGASNNQLENLIDSSAQCYQNVSFDCISSPLKVWYSKFFWPTVRKNYSSDFQDIWGYVFELNFTCIRHSFSTKTICARNPSPESALLCTLVNYWLYLQEMTCWSTALPLLLLHVSLDSIQDFNFNFGFQTSKASEYPTSLWECQKHLDMVQKIVFGPVWKTLAFPEWYRIFKILIGKSEV